MAEIEIEAFRAGTAASKGITAAQIAEAANSYNPDSNPAPIVIGHPGDDAPAFGAISGARVEGDKLFVKIKNLSSAIVDGVRESRLLNRSMAFWHPTHPSNPTPGKLSLRHLGFLGGQAPAIPNMAPLKFSAEDGQEATITAEGEPAAPMIFAAPEVSALDDNAIAGIADKVAAILKPTPPTPENKEFAVATEAELKAREDELAAREQAIKDKETQFAADEAERAKKAKEARETANAEFSAKIVGEGRFPAGHKDDLTAILNALPAETLTFSSDVKASPAEQLKTILGGATPVIKFEKITPPGEAQTFAASDDETAALAAAQQRQADAWKGK